MKSTSEAPTKLDLWVAGTMRSDEAIRRLTQAGGTLESATSLTHQLNTGVLAGPYVDSATSVTEAFGAPTSITPELLTYELTLWPLHYYQWRVLPDGRVVNKGFLLRSSPQAVRLETLDGAAASKAFEVWHHTTEDIERSLGTPRRRLGWWPEDTLYYTSASESQEVAFILAHSLLSKIMVTEAGQE